MFREHHFSVRKKSVLQFIAWSFARYEQLTEGKALARWPSRQVRAMRARRWLNE